MNQSPFVELVAKGDELPILISAPHAGTTIPDYLRDQIDPKFHFTQPDADWLVHRLYEFASDLGVTIIYGLYSRYVIDLNRDPQGAQLYSDGRKETGLVPTKTFQGESIYVKDLPSDDDINDRLETYYIPYHKKLQKTLDRLQRNHKKVLLLEAHSIARSVPSIRKEPFCDLMLGDNDGKSCASELTQSALNVLKGSKFKFSHNDPFKGGFITRSFGQPDRGYHAMQLEMAQDLYLNEAMQLDKKKIPVLQETLKKLLLDLVETLRK